MLQAGILDEHPAARNLRLLGADLVYSLPVLACWPAAAATPARPGGGRAAAGGGRAGRRVSRGLQGHRQAVQRALSAAAIRPRRVRAHGHARRAFRSFPCAIVGAEEIYPMVGDSEELAARAAAALLPDDPAVPMARAIGRGAAAVELDHRILRSGADRRLRARQCGRPGRESFPNWPTRSRTRSSPRSTSFWPSAVPLSVAAASVTRPCGTAGAMPAATRRRWHRPRRRPAARSSWPCGPNGNHGSASRRSCFARAGRASGLTAFG